MKQVFRLTGLLFIVILFGACATSNKQDNNKAHISEDTDTSSIKKEKVMDLK